MDEDGWNGGDAYFLLCWWCTASKRWHTLPKRHDSVQDAENSVRDRGIYHVKFVCRGRELPMEPYAIVGGHECDDTGPTADRVPRTTGQ